MRRILSLVFVLLLAVPLSAQLLGPPQNITIVDSGTACVTAPAACATFDVSTSTSVAFDDEIGRASCRERVFVGV